jgi:hypothetical protein
MQPDTFTALVNKLEALGNDVMDVKGPAYRNSDDVLANFKRTGAELGIPASLVCAIFMRKHIDSIMSWLRKTQAEKASRHLAPDDRLALDANGFVSGGEPLSGRFTDIRNYVLLLAGCITEDFGDFLGLDESANDTGETFPPGTPWPRIPCS